MEGEVFVDIWTSPLSVEEPITNIAVVISVLCFAVPGCWEGVGARGILN